jgi:hypothetical protein
MKQGLMPTRYEGYFASLDGRLYSTRRRKGWVNGSVIWTGYRRHLIWTSPTEKKNVYAHVLLAEAFFGPKPHGMEVNHKDCNKLNNSLENLEYVTPKANVEHAKRNGRYLRGQKHPAAKLTENQIKLIRASQSTAKDLAKVFHVTKGTIHKIRRGFHWKI